MKNKGDTVRAIIFVMLIAFSMAYFVFDIPWQKIGKFVMNNVVWIIVVGFYGLRSFTRKTKQEREINEIQAHAQKPSSLGEWLKMINEQAKKNKKK